MSRTGAIPVLANASGRSQERLNLFIAAIFTASVNLSKLSVIAEKTDN